DSSSVVSNAPLRLRRSVLQECRSCEVGITPRSAHMRRLILAIAMIAAPMLALGSTSASACGGYGYGYGGGGGCCAPRAYSYYRPAYFYRPYYRPRIYRYAYHRPAYIYSSYYRP